MLTALRITDLGVISDVEIELAPGLTVVTGETGAGKTMIVTGLNLLFGGRADASRVRTGAEQAVVEGRVLVTDESSVAHRAIEAGATIEDGELILRRTVTAAGRSRAQVGGAATPIAVLADVGDDVFALHGQSDQMRLSRPDEQRRALDRFASLDLAPYRAAFERWQAAEVRLTQRLLDTDALAQEADRLSFGLSEIDALTPLPGEDVELAALTIRLGAADELGTAARLAHDALLGDAENPTSDTADVQVLLSRAGRALSTVAQTDPQLAELGQRLEAVAAAAADLGAELSSYVDGIDADPSRLAQAQSRRAELTSLARKYSPGPGGDLSGVLAWADRARSRLGELDTSEDAIAALTADRDQAEALAVLAATKVRSQRVQAAHRLAAAVTTELDGLAMADARLLVTVGPRAATTNTPVLNLPGISVAPAGKRAPKNGPLLIIGANGPAGAGPDGADEVELLLMAHQDSPAIVLQRGASGGELSRVMLALEVVLAGTDPVPVMVFDEVDAGVGGRAAVEVGRRLAGLARRHQVIVVTHLAQVAAFADQHLVVGSVAGSADSGVTRSHVTPVQGSARITELARMLAGRDTVAARKHAAELIADAGGDGSV